MTLEQIQARLSEIFARQQEIDTEFRSLNDTVGDARMEGDSAERWTALETEDDNLKAEVAELEKRQSRLQAIEERAANPRNVAPAVPEAPQVNGGRSNEDPYERNAIDGVVRSRNVSELRARARTAIEEHRNLTDAQKEAVTSKLERSADPTGFVGQYVLRTGSDAYGSAINKYMAGAKDLWTDDERNAVAAAQEVRAAMSLTDANGGYAVPFTLDPNLIITNDGATNPVRQLARKATITTDSWNGLSSAGVTASWDGQIAEVSDDSPTFAQPSVTPKKAQAFVQGSIEITQDYPGLAADLQMLFADGKDRLEAAAFINGSGSNQPQGIITALDGGSSEVAPDTGETFAVGDVYKTLEALPPRYRAGNVAWIAELSTINAMRQFGTANNYHGFLTDLAAGQPRQLLGYSLFESSEMDAYADINTGATADNHLLVVGDWSKYLIVDRVGAVVEYIPHLFNTSNNLPDGRRGWYLHWRVGADSLVDGAFRALNVATAA